MRGKGFWQGAETKALPRPCAGCISLCGIYLAFAKPRTCRMGSKDCVEAWVGWE